MSGRDNQGARWFRSWASKLDNPKVQRLSDAHYRAWDNLLCVACKYGGVLPPLPDLAFLMRRSRPATARLIEALTRAGLFEKTERGIEPHDWKEWQYKSDVSSERVKRHRQRQRDAASAVTETDSENRVREQSSEEPDGSSAPPALADPVKSVFDEGVALLVKTGTEPRRARSIVGQRRARARDDARVAGLIREAQRRGISEPIPWFVKALAAVQADNDPWAGVDI
jgi:hypothetical protein